MSNEVQPHENDSLREGQLVSHGNYLLKRLLRDDVTGQVWLAARAEGPAQGELHELRFLPHAAAAGNSERKRLRAAITKLSRLKHPGLTQTHGYVHEDNEDIVSFEHFVAPSLADLSYDREGRVFPEEWLDRWLPQVLDALEYGHRETGLAHGHLKPQYILLNEGGQAKVLEFHLARLLRDILHPPGQTGGHGGATLAHASPERIAGKDLGVAEDVFSLGAILYELLAGEAPFAFSASATTPQSLAEVREKHAPSAAPVSEKLVNAIAACLDSNPAKRPRNIPELRNLLGIKATKKAKPTLVQDELPLDPAPPSKEQKVKPTPAASPATPSIAGVFPEVETARKRGKLAPLLAVAAVIALVLGVWGYMQSPKSQSTSPVASEVVAAGPESTNPPTTQPAPVAKPKPDPAAPPPATGTPAAGPAPVGAPASSAEQKLAQARQEEIRKLLSAANDALQRGDFEEGQVNYSTVAALTREYVGEPGEPFKPSDSMPAADERFIQSMRDSAAYAWHGRGECHFEEGKYTDALKEFQTAAEINPRNDQTQARIAQVMLELRQNIPAKEAMDLSLKLNPNQANAMLALGRWLVVEAQNYQKAIEVLDKAVTIRPELAEAYYWKGKAYGGLKDFTAEKENLVRSEVGFDQILKHRPRAGRWLAFRGSSRLWLSKFQGAADDFTEVIRMLPNYGFAYSNRGYAYLRLGQTRKAVIDLDQAIRLEPDLPANFVNRGDAYLRMGQPGNAVEDYTRALTLDATNPVAWHNRAMANLRLNRYQSALGDFDKAIELDPQSTVLYLNKASAQFQADEHPAAIRTFGKVLELDPANAQAFRDRGSAQFAIGMYQEAIADFTKSMELNAKDPLVYLRRGAALDANGEYQKAVEDYSKGIELSPKDPRFYKARADTYSTLSQFEKAEADFRKGEELTKESGADSHASLPL